MGVNRYLISIGREGNGGSARWAASRWRKRRWTRVGVLAFGIGLVFGFSLDTPGPRRRTATVDRRQDVVTPADHPASDEPLTAERPGAGTGTDPVASEARPVDEAAPTQTTDHS